MTRPIPYQYFVLRAVPRPEREEFVNVGVVLYAEELEALAMGWHLDKGRLRALDPHVDLEALRDALEHLESLARGGGSAGMARARRRGALFGWLAAPRSTLVQPGPVHGGVCPAPQEPQEPATPREPAEPARDATLEPIVDLLLDRRVRLPGPTSG